MPCFKVGRTKPLISITKKRIERFYLDRFIEIYDNTIKVLRESECPDFLCSYKGYILGIEVTRLKKKRLSEISGVQNKIVRKAKELAIEYGMKPMDVKIWFSEYMTDLKHEMVENAAEYLYQIVHRNIEQIQNNNGRCVTLDTSGNQYGILQVAATWGEVDGIMRLQYPYQRWRTIEPGWLSIEFRKDLQKVIDSKNQKVDLYKKEVQNCWLLIVVDRSKRDEQFDYSRMDSSLTYESRFERTFLFDLMERKIYQLLHTKRQVT